MGIDYQEPEESEEIPENNLPYTPTKGITHPNIPKLSEAFSQNSEDLDRLPRPNKPYTKETEAMLDEIGGIWEDEEETLDDLLNQLTP